jgi:hypothetical protein
MSGYEPLPVPYRTAMVGVSEIASLASPVSTGCSACPELNAGWWSPRDSNSEYYRVGVA